MLRPPRWCKGKRARLECSVSWVRSVGWVKLLNYKFMNCCFCAKYGALRCNKKEGLARNQDVSRVERPVINELLFHAVK